MFLRNTHPQKTVHVFKQSSAGDETLFDTITPTSQRRHSSAPEDIRLLSLGPTGTIERCTQVVTEVTTLFCYWALSSPIPRGSATYKFRCVFTT